MKSKAIRLTLVAAALTVAAVLFAPAITHADEFNLKTFITVSQPFQVPGAVLQPNVKYVLRRADANGDLHVLRVLNADETEVLSTFFAVSDERMEPADNTVITFYETAPGYAKPIHEWFYPGRLIGYEFIYPKDKMRDINAHLHGTATEIQTAETFTQPSEETAQPEENMIAQNTLPEPEVQREKPAELTPEVTEPESTPEPAVTNEEQTPAPAEAPAKELPKTAGELPLIGLIGLAAMGLRQALRRR